MELDRGQPEVDTHQRLNCPSPLYLAGLKWEFLDETWIPPAPTRTQMLSIERLRPRCSVKRSEIGGRRPR